MNKMLLILVGVLLLMSSCNCENGKCNKSKDKIPYIDTTEVSGEDTLVPSNFMI